MEHASSWQMRLQLDPELGHWAWSKAGSPFVVIDQYGDRWRQDGDQFPKKDLIPLQTAKIYTSVSPRAVLV